MRRRKPEAAATPRDVAHIRIGSFALLFLVAVGVLGLIAGVPLIAVIAAVVAVGVAIDIALAVRRQRGSTEAG